MGCRVDDSQDTAEQRTGIFSCCQSGDRAANAVMGSAAAAVDAMAVMDVGRPVDANRNADIVLDENVKKLIAEEHTVGLHMNFTRCR